VANVYIVSARYRNDDVPVFSSGRESACIDFVLRNFAAGKFAALHALAEQLARRAIENVLLGYDIYQVSPEIMLICHEDVSVPLEEQWEASEWSEEEDDDDDDDLDLDDEDDEGFDLDLDDEDGLDFDDDDDLEEMMSS
jgi:hypothetical protein